MQTSGFAELSDFQPPPAVRVRSPRLLAWGAGLFTRRIGHRVQQGVMLMAAPVTFQAIRSDADGPRELQLPWGSTG